MLSRRRRAWLRATTALRSSTLYTNMPSTSPSSLATLRGTEMSTSITRCLSSGTGRFSTVRMGSVAAVDVKTMSAPRTMFTSASIGCSLSSTSGIIFASSSARSTERFTTWIVGSPRELRCCTSKRDILPAPMMATRASLSSTPSSGCALSATSSTAAEEIDTAPLAMLVSERTRRPAETATFSSRDRIFPALPSAALEISKQRRTCERIWPSPMTSESSPADTRSRCHAASSSGSTNSTLRSSATDNPLRCARKRVACSVPRKTSSQTR
mmetsp:Transcript_769/g.2072  ORF Transcript_769/g.2072 Transcript_769/m.2072 type:complete len:270 (+) Transcript_769:1709-2518(+)